MFYEKDNSVNSGCIYYFSKFSGLLLPAILKITACLMIFM